MKANDTLRATIIANCFALPSYASAYQDQIRRDMQRREARHAPEIIRARRGDAGSIRNTILTMLDEGPITCASVREATGYSSSKCGGVLKYMHSIGILERRIVRHDSGVSYEYTRRA